jgi:hypothetical protein
MKRRENVRGSVTDDVERKILSDAKARGISKAGWVSKACEKVAREGLEPKTTKSKPKESGIIAGNEVDDFIRYVIALREKQTHELQNLINKARSLKKRKPY